MKLAVVIALLGSCACSSNGESPKPCVDATVVQAATTSSAAQQNGKGSPQAPSPEPARGDLQFVGKEKTQSLRIDDLIAELDPTTIEVDDPYYKKKKRYRALALGKVLEKGFARSAAQLAATHFTFQAKDGYETSLPGDRVLDSHVYLAFADLDAGRFQPIGPRGADPGPLYMVWTGAGRNDTDLYPHPWALVRIIAGEPPQGFDKTQPPGGFGNDTAARLGHAIFERRCLHCHSINRQGGKLGPELNLPRNILSYRSEADVRAFIKDPQSFRYSNMLANPDLTEKDLDGIVAYLRAMSQTAPGRAASPP